jgi:UDP-N-acetylmuramoyl-tripeptide--D-alanyl-D-alanine ligase
MPAIVAGLGSFRPLAGRLSIRQGLRGARVIDDSYNANPDSVRAAIDVLASVAGRRCLVLGDMGEVGAMGPAFHREIGEYAREAGIERLLGIGALTADAVAAFGLGGAHFPDADALSEALVGDVDQADTILVKGSRFMRMERIVAKLVGDGEARTH